MVSPSWGCKMQNKGHRPQTRAQEAAKTSSGGQGLEQPLGGPLGKGPHEIMHKRVVRKGSQRDPYNR